MFEIDLGLGRDLGEGPRRLHVWASGRRCIRQFISAIGTSRARRWRRLLSFSTWKSRNQNCDCQPEADGCLLDHIYHSYKSALPPALYLGSCAAVYSLTRSTPAL